MLQIDLSDKLYIITREDLPFGAQAVQGGHVLAEFLFEHKEIAEMWHQNSNSLIFLVVKNEQELLKLIDKGFNRGIEFSVFFEPDLDYQLTAVALAPGKETKRLCSNLKLALKEKGK